MAHHLIRNGWRVLGWNMRGCGGTPNRLRSWYHSGQSADLEVVVTHALSRTSGPLALVGFSIGGNITLKLLGEAGATLNPRVLGAVAISVPIDLHSSALQLARPRNQIYMQYLLKPLRTRIVEKAQRFPNHFDLSGLRQIRTFYEFDRRYTAPFHGFESVEQYWAESSSARFLADIARPTLLVNALDDPFLAAPCFPYQSAAEHPYLTLETPRHGGHVGFISRCLFPLFPTWIEQRTGDFLTQQIRLSGRSS
jgi:predicted alpha/beta-fold hydrolase